MMKKLLLLTIALCFGLYTIGQQRALVPAKDRNVKVVKKIMNVKDGVSESNQQYKPGEKAASMLDQEIMGFSTYDLQSNRSPQNRLYLFDDGSMGAVWTMDLSSGGNSGDRGTGYNYYNGSTWGPQPAASIEDTKTGWPSYSNYGVNGELFVCHHMTEGLLYGIRETKGEGEWVIDIQEGPTGAKDISWPIGVTSGENNDVIHFLSVTYQSYLGQDGGLLYSRSDDGGLNWDPENLRIEDIGVDNYYDIGGDCYDWAEPRAGQLAFVIGDKWGCDVALMKSDDDGDSWDKTVVWESPYPLDPGMPTDTFYCADGSHHVALDTDGDAHVVFSIARVQIDDFAAGSYTNFPLTDGIVYWNEDMDAFSPNINALNPYDHPDSELIEDYNLIGWSQDVDGDGEVTIVDPLNIAEYQVALSSHAQLVIDDMDRIFMIYSSVTETFVNASGDQNYRHIWARGSVDGGDSWGEFVDLHSNIIYSFDENVFPSVAPKSDGNIYFYYQVDDEPGMNIQGDGDPVADNWMKVETVSDAVFFPVGVEENAVTFNEDNVSQNFPNPFNGTSSVFVTLDKQATLELVVTNMVGQSVYTVPAQKYNKGRQEIAIDATGLTSGVYFYTVKSGDKSVTKKMIVE